MKKSKFRKIVVSVLAHLKTFIILILVILKRIFRKRQKLVPGEPVKPKPGNVFNPFTKYPPNESCYCGSGLKFKKCCKLIEPVAIPKAVADQAAPLVKKMRNKQQKKKKQK